MSNTQSALPTQAQAMSDKALRRRLMAYLKPNWRLLVAGFLCSIGVAVVSLGLPFIAGTVLTILTNKKPMLLNLVCIGVVALFGVKWIFSYGQMVFFAEAGQRIGLRLRNQIYAHLQSLSLSFFDRQRTGNLISTLSNDVPLLQTGILTIKDMVSSPIIVIGGLAAIFKIDFRLSLAALLVMPIMAYAMDRLSKRLRAIALETQNKLADVTTITEETLAGIRLIRSFAAEKREIARYETETTAAKNVAMRGVRRAATVNPTTDMIGAVGIAFALWYGVHEVISGYLSVYHLGVFVLMLDRIRTGISSLGSIMVTWRQTQGAAERIFGNVLDVPTDVVESPSAKPLPAVVGEVRFENVSFGYYADRPVLKDISLMIRPGEVVAVVGHSGAGKSTLADLIPRFYDPTEGAILVDSTDIRDVTLDSLRRQIGIVPQDTILFGGTVRENIAYGMPDATLRQIEEAAHHANAHEFIACDLPNGYDTIVGERGVKLSGGQKQRIAIARALLKNPRILILDEATSSLDPKSELLVQEALEVLMRGRSTLVIAHRLSTIQYADRIVVLDAGQIIEEGTHQELLHLGGTYKELYENQFRETGDTAPALP